MRIQRADSQAASEIARSCCALALPALGAAGADRQAELAEADFREAIALAQKIGAKAWELRARCCRR
jgi:hypothetical protein